jgi:hypothetical protein
VLADVQHHLAAIPEEHTAQPRPIKPAAMHGHAIIAAIALHKPSSNYQIKP